MEDYTKEERSYIAELIKMRRALHDAIIKAWYEYLCFDVAGVGIESENFTITLELEEFYNFFDGFRAGWEGRVDSSSFLLEYTRDDIDCQRYVRAGYNRGRRFRECYKCPELIDPGALKY